MNKNYIRLNNYTDIFSYFVILLPIFLISGPFLSDLAISTLAIFSLFIIREKNILIITFYYFYDFLDFNSFKLFFLMIKFYLLKIVFFILDFVYFLYLFGGF